MMNLTKKQYTLTDKVLVIVCVLATVVMVYALNHFKTAKVHLAKNETAQINYDMAKLQNSESLYSLENREIELNYKALQVAATKMKAQQSKTVVNKTKAAVPTAAVASRMSQQATAARKAFAQQQALKRAQNAVQKPSHEAVQSTDEHLTQTPVQGHDVSQAPVDTTKPKDENKTDKKTYEQWKNEIFAAQSKESIMKFVAAYKKGDVTAEEYQKLASEMLVSKDDKMVGLGLYALRSAPSYASYVQLVKVQGNVNSTYATYVQESLMAYNQTSNLAYLKQSLSSTDKTVVLKTLEIIKSGVTSIKSGEVTDLMDPRNRRNSATSQFSLTNYLSFLPLLKNLTNSTDQDIVNLANQNITLIDDPQFVAAN